MSVRAKNRVRPHLSQGRFFGGAALHGLLELFDCVYTAVESVNTLEHSAEFPTADLLQLDKFLFVPVGRRGEGKRKRG